MLLTDLKPNEGARKNRKRVGRGRASGHGKTSTRGHNGQGQRSGESKRFGFEGGQTPLFRRLPKIHNFDEVITRHWVEVNVGALNGLSANFEVTPESLVEAKVLRDSTDSLRILGNGELKVALKVKAHHISEGAKQKIEAAGGSVTLIEPNKPEEGKHAKRLPRAIKKKEQEIAAAKAEKEAALQAKKEKAEGGGAKKAPAKEKSDKGGGQQKGGGDKKQAKSGDKKK